MTQDRENNREPTDTGKPFAGFEDYDACVTEFEDDPDIDDPEKFCGYLQEEHKSGAEKVLSNLKLDYVSAVGEPAQRSEWVVVKDEDGESHPVGVATEDTDTGSPFLAAESTKKAEVPPSSTSKDDEGGDEQRKACAAVLVPEEVDKHGEQIPRHEIEDAAHDFLKMDGSTLSFEGSNIDSDHDRDGGKASVVESWTLKDTRTYSTHTGEEIEYPEGTWMMTVEFHDEETWNRVKDGELQGFSIDGQAVPIEEHELTKASIGERAAAVKSQAGDGCSSDIRVDTLERQVAGIADTVDSLVEIVKQQSENDHEPMTEDNADDVETEKQLSAQEFYELIASHVDGADAADVTEAIGDVGEYTGVDRREFASAIANEYGVATGEVLDALEGIGDGGDGDGEAVEAEDDDEDEDKEKEAEDTEEAEKEDADAEDAEKQEDGVTREELKEEVGTLKETVENLTEELKADDEDEDEEDEAEMEKEDAADDSDREVERKAKQEQTPELTDTDETSDEDVEKSAGDGETTEHLEVTFGAS